MSLLNNLQNNISEKVENHKQKKEHKKEMRRQQVEREFNAYVENIIENAKAIASKHDISVTEALQVMSIISIENMHDDISSDLSSVKCDLSGIYCRL